MAGAHTVGRAYPNRSGFGKESTKYTKDGPGTKGGSSWTPEWCASRLPFKACAEAAQSMTALVLTQICMTTCSQ